jgi:hypothetical protein
MKKLERVPGFGPSDPTDSRPLWDWKSRYPADAAKEIRREAVYLGVLLSLVPWLLLAFFCRFPRVAWTHLDAPSQDAMRRYGAAWISGMLGGTLFALKWLYHVVARGLWNLDRRLWRLFTPHISGGLAFAVTALVASGILRIFDTKAMHSISVVVSLAFLVGYFSDSAVAKLTEISDTLFGTSRSKEKHIPELAQNASSGDAGAEHSKNETNPGQ